MPFVMRGLRAFQTYTLCTITIGVITDMCEAVEGKIQPFCDAIMGGLREALQDMTVNRDVKPVVISCFGDIAMAIGAAYEPYLQMSVMLLMQAAQQRAPEGDEDLIFFINSLRLSILEAYSGIVMGLADGNGLHLLVPHVPAIMEFLLFLSQDASSRDEEVLQKSVALVGDIAQEMGSQPQVLQQLNQPFIAKLIQDASHDPNAREVALFANNAIHKALSQG